MNPTPTKQTDRKKTFPLRQISSLILVLILLSLTHGLVHADTAEQKALTLMIYMCGSNLESQYGSASDDILEMLSSGVDTKQVNVLILTGGSHAWQIPSGPASTGVSLLSKGQLKSLQMDEDRSMGDPATLTSLLTLGLTQYPAEQYALLLWDHGAGPLEGVCLDELNTPDRLSISELVQALSDACLPDKLSWIGFDACLMSSAEVALAMAPFAHYMIASQETEPASGWDYAFLEGIEQDIDGAATGCRIVDGYFGGAHQDMSGLTLACLDLARIADVTEEMDRFFSPLGSTMNEKTFTDLSEIRMSSTSFGKVVRGITSDGYDLVDLGDLVSRYGKDDSSARVLRALDETVVYARSSKDGTCGLSVYHPLRNKAGYTEQWKDGYASLSFSPGYQRYLNAFGTLLTGKSLADWSGLQVNLKEDASGSQFSLQLTEEQRANTASAQLLVLAVVQHTFYSELASQLSENGAPAQGQSVYYPIHAGDIPITGSTLSAAYSGRGLYMLDAEGNVAAGPISYTLSDDGSRFYIHVSYMDDSGREHPAPNTMVLFTCEPDPETDGVNILQAEVYDPVTENYTRRIAFDEHDFTRMALLDSMRLLPEENGLLPGIADWPKDGIHQSFAIPRGWKLHFMEEQLSGLPLYATIQITDMQQNTHCTPPVRIFNPNLHHVQLSQQVFSGKDFELSLYAVLDTSALNPGLLLEAQIVNTSEEAIVFDASGIIANGHRLIDYQDGLYLDVSSLEPGETRYQISHLDPVCLAELGEISDLSFSVRTRPRGQSSSKESDSILCACQVSGCNVSAFDSLLAPTLAKDDGNGLEWRLVSLEKNRTGGLTGLLHIVNPTDREIYRYGTFTVNDRVQTNDTFGFTAQPHTDSCIPFTISNRINSSYRLHVTDVDSRVYLGMDHLLERSGIDRIESLGLTQRNDQDDPLHFELSTAVPFASEEELISYRAEESAGPRPLLEGILTVEAERLLIADDGLALTLSLRNNSDRDLSLNIGHKTVEGRDSTYQVEDFLIIGAGISGYACIEIMLEDGLAMEIGSISEITMTFRLDNYTMEPAVIRLNTPAAPAQSGGVYLSKTDFETIPAPLSPLDLTVTAEDVTFPNGLLTLMPNIRFENTDIFQDYNATAADTRVCLPIHLINTSVSPMHYGFFDFMLNGQEPDQYLGIRIENDLEAGASADGEIRIFLTDLLSSGSPVSLTFTLTSQPSDKSAQMEYTTIHLLLTHGLSAH